MEKTGLAPALSGRKLLDLRRGQNARQDRLKNRSIVHIAVDFPRYVRAREHRLPVSDKLQHALRTLRDLASPLGARLLVCFGAIRGRSPVFHALSLGALVHRRRDIDVTRLMASVIDAGIVPSPRQVQVRVIGPLLPQRQKIGLAAPRIAEAVENAPALVPEHLPGLWVPQRFPLGAEAVFRQRPDRQQDMRVDIAVGALMDGPVRREPP